MEAIMRTSSLRNYRAHVECAAVETGDARVALAASIEPAKRTTNVRFH